MASEGQWHGMLLDRCGTLVFHQFDVAHEERRQGTAEILEVLQWRHCIHTRPLHLDVDLVIVVEIDALRSLLVEQLGLRAAQLSATAAAAAVLTSAVSFTLALAEVCILGVCLLLHRFQLLGTTPHFALLLRWLRPVGTTTSPSRPTSSAPHPTSSAPWSATSPSPTASPTASPTTSSSEAHLC